MTTVTISDIGHTVVMLDQEIDRLNVEELNLRQQLELNRARAEVLKVTMTRLINTNLYELIDR